MIQFGNTQVTLSQPPRLLWAYNKRAKTGQAHFSGPPRFECRQSLRLHRAHAPTYLPTMAAFPSAAVDPVTGQAGPTSRSIQNPQVFTLAPQLLAASPFPDCPHGATLMSEAGREVSFKVWAPHAASVSLLLQGTLAAATSRLEHVASLGFTAVQLMPISEHSDAWGYNPRLLMALHGAYGTPDDLRRFVDKAHSLGLGVIIDVVLHHGAVDGNSLWEYDGWGPDWNGGIYHEGGHDTQWGRGFAFWKREVLAMAEAACATWLCDFRCDGLRFDSANDLPREAIQYLTWSLRQRFPGRILTAEVTPENPQSVHELGFDSVWVHSGYFDIIQQHRALGRGHHGGGDWAAGWDLPRLRTVMALHPGFTSPTQCIKYLLGSHDQVGCRNGGAWYKDYEMIGGQHRYAVDQYGGGRGDWSARASSRLWYTANVAAAGLPMMFMDRRLQWSLSTDEVGTHSKALVAGANELRNRFPALRRGWANILHEDRANGVVAFERVIEGETRLVAVINAGRKSWLGGDYGVWVGQAAGQLEEVFCSQATEFGGNVESGRANNEPRAMYDGKIWINLPDQCTLVFQHTL
ncbi:1,4-alpha-glucan branching enzyme II [Volvox carteri f. nagariensis]|uniref:1,4-alpha-glucan branching enzyme n=1 Tax=Volvox carteri f. nagariensis TaxID=3068 RepID=D8U2N0_VOLCA|nr:1,4-alpha-glucan branching enzyme II [Volvox carteri f. nagariensis]EFJ45925.1 1,4-alpha-glucan branching enzyme II [Volvox carteri f. nagariensis]|eukprot:XP_002953003.1 1,4-alpha-glucan branching enzyme II [Volvox carteri f. nagariensis]